MIGACKSRKFAVEVESLTPRIRVTALSSGKQFVRIVCAVESVSVTEVTATQAWFSYFYRQD